MIGSSQDFINIYKVFDGNLKATIRGHVLDLQICGNVIMETIAHLITQVHEYQNSIQEYYCLSKKDSLSKSEAGTFQKILNHACNDHLFNSLLEKADDILLQESLHRNTIDIKTKQQKLKQEIEQSWIQFQVSGNLKGTFPQDYAGVDDGESHQNSDRIPLPSSKSLIFGCSLLNKLAKPTGVLALISTCIVSSGTIIVGASTFCIRPEIRELNNKEKGKNFSHQNLCQEDLTDAYLEEANLEGTNLKEATLAHANLKKSDLSHANLKNANLEEANLENAKLDKADLEKANLEEADLKGAVLIEAHLQKADLQEAQLKKADLRNANLEEADLKEVQLKEAILIEAHLLKADLRNADLRNANFEEADLRNANLEEADLQNASMKNADLSQGNSASRSLDTSNPFKINSENTDHPQLLTGANLRNTDLRNANFEGANLEGANFEGANLANANFEGANLANANFEGAKNMEDANFKDAELDGIKLGEMLAYIDKKYNNQIQLIEKNKYYYPNQQILTTSCNICVHV